MLTPPRAQNNEENQAGTMSWKFVTRPKIVRLSEIQAWLHFRTISAAASF
jgi:hypothetical protein